MVKDELDEARGKEQGAFTGQGDEVQTADDFAEGVLDSGQLQRFHEEEIFRNIAQVFGVDAGLLKELPEGFWGHIDPASCDISCGRFSRCRVHARFCGWLFR